MSNFKLALCWSVLLLIIGCASPHQKASKSYKDYSLIRREGIDELKNVSAYKDVYVQVEYLDSHRSNIYIMNKSENVIKVIESYRIKNFNVYHFLFNNYKPGAREGLYMVYHDSVSKEYTFGLQYGNHSDLIMSSYTLYSPLKNIAYHTLVKKADTVDFMNKIWDFDTKYLNNRTDSILDIGANDVFTIKDWLRKHR